MRTQTAAIVLALAGTLLWPASGTRAQTAPSGTQVAQAAPDAASAAPHRSGRPLRRLRIYPRYEAEPDGVYPRYNPGPNAVRDCTANYVEEYRPSGTVIVPRMHCFWRPG
ncbi:MAG: hypothetical protein KGK16_04200 [Bradyrhizobium sp.]|nr:hypothetical protein [Bradyrhizobium sp.]